MKSAERRFIEVSSKKPYWSSYLCFCEAIDSQKFQKKTIQKWFHKLVDKDDYFVEDGMKGLFQHLFQISNPVKDNKRRVAWSKKVAVACMKQG
ncbi:MAG: hypothetical protein A2452_12225 [Candidatus Firestonebacteria bacterium RIFOXYC2_FULL_39_67]|nr:MAG: hypothetical protein A2536_07755 [Candidatus Firestonebacteria bacterium RIFOXYD2_FULL_39_29]OGF55615.1 MAG: hypothetical protein A2452_12225 [Candidatus Firestonebacteria bacterium RIFOXYC2_FULL_39_67]